MNAAGRRSCPGCQSALQAFFAHGVEVDRCFFCGGIWLDGGELEQVVGGEVEQSAHSSPTTRRCAGCALTLQAVRMGEVVAERCSSCHGIYLDQGELELLAQREVALTQALKEGGQQDEVLTFRCQGCGDVLPYPDGFETPGGLACRHCRGALDATSSVVAPGGLWMGDAVRMRALSAATPGGVGGLVYLAWRLFRA